jgi:Flp pilus assembly protein TadG
LKKKFKLYEEEDGVGVVWFALSFIVIIFIAGLAIDGGRLYETKAELRKAADAAVLSGAQDLEISDSSVTNLVNQILIAHNEESSLKELMIRPNNENKITVTLERNVPLYFMKLFNFNSTPVSVTSSAAIYPISRTIGTVPFGINKDTQFEFMKEYQLKVDSGDALSGNFGILALAGVGGKLYEDALKYGYDSELTVGDIVDTQTGNVAQKTVNGVNYRIDTSPYDPGDLTHRDDPRIIAILVYEPYQVTTNQVKSIRICGFAYFYLAEPMSSKDSTVNGYFIKKVGTGISDPSVLDKGAYAIKLVE